MHRRNAQKFHVDVQRISCSECTCTCVSKFEMIPGVCWHHISHYFTSFYPYCYFQQLIIENIIFFTLLNGFKTKKHDFLAIDQNKKLKCEQLIQPTIDKDLRLITMCLGNITQLITATDVL